MTRPKLMSFDPMMSDPFVEKNPFESSAGRNKCESKPEPLAPGIAFCASAGDARAAIPTADSALHAILVAERARSEQRRNHEGVRVGGDIRGRSPIGGQTNILGKRGDLCCEGS